MCVGCAIAVHELLDLNYWARGSVGWGPGFPLLVREEARMIREVEEGRLGERGGSRSDAGGIAQKCSQTCAPAWASTHTAYLCSVCPQREEMRPRAPGHCTCPMRRAWCFTTANVRSAKFWSLGVCP